MAAEITETAT